MTKKPTDIRKREIIDTARVLIVHQGIKALTINNLAIKMKISEPALYRHFKNKSAILLALIEDFESHLSQGITDAMRSNPEPLSQLRSIMQTHMLLSERKKGIFFAITSESINFKDKGLKKKVLEVIKGYQDKIEVILKLAKKQKKIRQNTDLNVASLAFFGLIQTSIILYALTDYKTFPLAKADALWEIFLRGIKDNGKAGVDAKDADANR